MDPKAAKHPRLSSSGEDIPKIAHVIWLGNESGGSAPSERMLNIISLGKQIKSAGWRVKLWTNKPIVVERAALGVGLPDESPCRGGQLETWVRFSYGKNSKNSIELCSDKELSGVLEGIDQKSYCDDDGVSSIERKRHLADVHNKYELPLLWCGKETFNGQSKDKTKKRVASALSSKQ